MKVKILYFASLREQLGTSGEELELPAGVKTMAQLRSHLRARGGAYEIALSDRKLLRTALNQDMAKPTSPLKAGDEVAFFPPVTGG